MSKIERVFISMTLLGNCSSPDILLVHKVFFTDFSRFLYLFHHTLMNAELDRLYVVI